MNKSDLKLILIIFSITIILILIMFITKENGSKKAVVYYENDIILNIDLNNNIEENYIVKGYNGDVKIVVKNGKIKVDEENSPRHLCSKQGFISESYETIVCLPNKIIIKIESNDDYDTIVG